MIYRADVDCVELHIVVGSDGNGDATQLTKSFHCRDCYDQEITYDACDFFLTHVS